jgi:hypothetical protein
VAHELGHIAQFRLGRNVFPITNREQDADAFAMAMCLIAGFDPYAGAGALAKLSMAYGTAGLLAQAFDDLVDPHGSFNSRIDTMYSFLTFVCTQVRVSCETYKSFVHPNFPPVSPLTIERSRPTSIRFGPAWLNPSIFTGTSQQ